MNENVVKTKALAEKGKAAAIDQLNKLSEKADAIPFFKGNISSLIILVDAMHKKVSGILFFINFNSFSLNLLQ